MAMAMLMPMMLLIVVVAAVREDGIIRRTRPNRRHAHGIAVLVPDDGIEVALVFCAAVGHCCHNDDDTLHSVVIKEKERDFGIAIRTYV